jgi:tetratricopeptide (TPR) repeat protein
MFDTVDEKARLRRQRSEEAIALAMKGQWKEAIAVNLSIIEVVPTDVDAYNRLGKAYIEMGELARAKEAYTKALELDQNNSIARKNLERVAQLDTLRVAINNDRSKVSPDFFIGELGKTGVLNLQKLGPSAVLAKMTARDQVYLKVQGHKIAVENEQGEYLGLLEPQHGNRLAKLMEGGNKYTAAIYSLDNNKAKVFVRESFQHPDLAGKPSFPTKAAEDFQPHIKDTLLRHGETDEELLEEEGETEDADLEEGELLPSGFSIFDAGVYMDEMGEDELLDEE